MRKIVEKEGKIARNLVAWSVPSEKGIYAILMIINMKTDNNYDISYLSY